MMNFPSQEVITKIRERYPVGALVEVVQIDDPYTSLSRGERGEIYCVDDIGTIHVRWESGSTLGVVFGVDKIKLVKHC